MEYFPGFTTLQLCYKVQEFLSKMSVEPEDFTGRIIILSIFNDISWGSKENKQECELSARLVSIYAKKVFTRKMVIPRTGSEKKWYSTRESKPQGEWDRVAELMMFKFGESGHPVFRSTSPLSREVLKSKGGGQLSIHLCADEGTIETVFAHLFLLISSVSTEQSQICVKNANPAILEQGDLCFGETT